MPDPNAPKVVIDLSNYKLVNTIAAKAPPAKETFGRLERLRHSYGQATLTVTLKSGRGLMAADKKSPLASGTSDPVRPPHARHVHRAADIEDAIPNARSGLG